MRFPGAENARFAEDQNICELTPVFVVAVDDQGDVGILGDVFEPLEFGWRGALRFLVNRRIEIPSIESKADRNHMRLAGFVRGGEMSDAGGAD